MLGERLRLLREEKEVTQQEVADAVSSAQQNISNYEKGSVEPDCETLIKLADFFDTTVDFILGHSNQRHPVEIYEALEDLPMEGAREAEVFMEFLKYKYKFKKK